MALTNIVSANDTRIITYNNIIFVILLKSFGISGSSKCGASEPIPSLKISELLWNFIKILKFISKIQNQIIIKYSS